MEQKPQAGFPKHDKHVVNDEQSEWEALTAAAVVVATVRVVRSVWLDVSKHWSMRARSINGVCCL